MDSCLGNALFYPELIRLEKIIACNPVIRDLIFNIYKRVLNYDIHDRQRLQRFVKGQRTIPETFKERGFQSKVSFSVGLHDDASLEQKGRKQMNL